MTVEGFEILLVDDEVDFLDMLTHRLQKRVLAVRQASGGESALEMLTEHLSDVVLLDVRMPGMDGLATLRAIKRRWPLVEVILLSGHASPEVAVEGMDLGAFDYLIKPVDMDELVYKLQDAAEKKRLREQRMENPVGNG